MTDIRQGMLVVLSGPSGVGKGTVRTGVLDNNPNMTLSVSATTRKIREGEKEGRDYFYITEEEFSNMIENDEFLEYIQSFAGKSYGTPRKYVEEHIAMGKDVLLEVDVCGGLKVKEVFPEAVLIFLAPPSMDELRRRLVARGTETEENIQKRTEIAYKEMQYISYYDYIVVNSTVEKASESIIAILYAEKSRVSRSGDFISMLVERREII